MRICIVAEHASTRFGGEAILPVHYFRLLRSRGIEAWLVVHERTRAELETIFRDDQDRIVFVPDLWLHKLIYHAGRPLPRRLSESTLGLMNQMLTQFLQRSIVRRLVRDQRIDVVHQPIPVAPKFPSALFGLGAPVVIGPLNGGMDYPPAFRRAEGWASRAGIALGRRFSGIANALIPGKRQARVVLVANARTREALPPGIGGDVIELVENGVDSSIWQPQSDESLAPSKRFVYIGRMVDWKAVDVVIRAVALVPGAELELIGDGPMAPAWRALAKELEIEERVHFSGWLPQRECPARIRSALALVLPSIYECGGAVVLEAMAMGKPAIATRWGGPADYLDESCGILVAPDSFEGMVAGFAEAMQRLIESPLLAESMGQSGRQRALRDFDWDRKMDRMMEIYRQACFGEA